jgi:riboflavin biosynthesis pyrimidine reductase
MDSVPAIQGTQYFTPLVITPQLRLSEVEASLSDVDVRILPYRVIDESSSWPKAIEEVIRHEGYQSPILESGQETLRAFIASGVVSEICLSISSSGTTGLSARDLSASNLQKVFGQADHFTLISLFTDGRTTFSRWALNGVAAPQLSA